MLLATKNKHKVTELTAMLEAASIRVRVASLIDSPGLALPEETGDTMEENAKAKAQAAAKATGLISVADDSGLEVDALEGAPGIHSKRFAGDNATDPDRYGKLLSMLKGVPEEKRQARFRCCIAIAEPDKEPIVVEGICRGKIALSPAGEFGFGYDPVFIPEGMNCTMAQLHMEEKNRISHRFRALAAAMPVLKQLLSVQEK
ncbi:MAG: RdgB/HAM1 family non-canonical purine NTP pyrophosphatase [Armatimonadetes bacterium]|nr:RdgB/HAM1 family non-canonical purine NTP pyrophosphatase [Armatimonadota bacterium]NIM24532.1 RdgB/HAM1 family non-canonical purine NTP pyrophosphatase [Armatimonadota bacterium]NIM68406.1 RdgB/HAM1 family non-canonical purine NTP pyrophosphatase [Armatimonadota bacterium]NIM76792.1 RdgB/HAM1 family non-canonical purine NTP pyrophosphatase [Armatimonadota bacterium]NIN06605.1 RdgB/HAM1 family non-canonical purine NTP pyrophosphatase [Armatimonadota bacterium]